MNGAETRAEHIDPAMKAAGWDVVEGGRIRHEYPITLNQYIATLHRGVVRLQCDIVRLRHGIVGLHYGVVTG